MESRIEKGGEKKRRKRGTLYFYSLLVNKEVGAGSVKGLR